MNHNKLPELFNTWCKRLRLIPDWDVKLEFVEDPEWRKTGDFKVDCDDKKAILLLNSLKRLCLYSIFPHSGSHCVRTDKIFLAGIWRKSQPFLWALCRSKVIQQVV